MGTIQTSQYLSGHSQRLWSTTIDVPYVHQVTYTFSFCIYREGIFSLESEMLCVLYHKGKRSPINKDC